MRPRIIFPESLELKYSKSGEQPGVTVCLFGLFIPIVFYCTANAKEAMTLHSQPSYTCVDQSHARILFFYLIIADDETKPVLCSCNALDNTNCFLNCLARVMFIVITTTIPHNLFLCQRHVTQLCIREHIVVHHSMRVGMFTWHYVL